MQPIMDTCWLGNPSITMVSAENTGLEHLIRISLHNTSGHMSFSMLVTQEWVTKLIDKLQTVTKTLNPEIIYNEEGSNVNAA